MIINKAQHWTSHLLLEAVHDWLRALECHDSCNHLFLDLVQGFDSMPQYWLLLKFQTLGISGLLLNWIGYFLTTWSQQVVINGQYSEWLGPLLFILYTDDVRYVDKHSSVKILPMTFPFILRYHAMTIALSYKMICHACINNPQVEAYIELKNSEAINICNKYSTVNFKFIYYIGSCPVLWSQKLKYLVIINSKPNWNDHHKPW